MVKGVKHENDNFKTKRHGAVRRRIALSYGGFGDRIAGYSHVQRRVPFPCVLQQREVL